MLWPAQPRLVSVGSTTSARSSVVSVISSRLLDGFDDIDVPRAAADVALDRLADLPLARARVRVEQILGGHEHPRRAVPALQRMRLAERLLERMELVVLREPLDRVDRRAVGLDSQHHAALDRVAVVEDRARAAVARVAADVRSGQLQIVSDEVDEQPARLDLALVQLAVELDLDRLLSHPLLLACATARIASTSARCLRYAPDPLTSEGGSRPALRTASRTLSSSGREVTTTGTADTQPIATRASPFTVAATLTMPVPSLPTVTEKKPSPVPPAVGMETFVSSSPGPTAVMYTPRKNSSAATVRVPPAPAMVMVAPVATISGGRWFVGSFEQTLPPTVPRLRTWTSAIRDATSPRIGRRSCISVEPIRSARVAIAPNSRPPSAATVIGVSSSRSARSTSRSGEAARC